MENQHFAEQTPLEKMRWSALLIAFSLLWAGAADANGGIVTDGSLGRPSSVFSPGIGGPDQVIITQSAGQISGHNLFQSFSNFNISKGQTVTFAEDQRGFVDNVIARVTGKESSTINGTLRVTPDGHANFYLLNPNGVIFGNGAQIDVPGDFHVTTAHFIKFQDGAKYSADPVHSKLSAANPSSFGFTGSSKGNNVLIEVKDGAQLSNPKGGPSANTLDLVGQNIKVDNGGQVSANDVRFVATKGTGSVTLDRDSYGYLKLPTTMPTGANSGTLVVDGQGSLLSSSTDGGGHIALWGGLHISHGGTITSTQTGTQSPNTSNGITVRASGFRMDNQGLIQTIKSGNGATGGKSNISVRTTGSVIVDSGSVIASADDVSMNSGDVTISSESNVYLHGSNRELSGVHDAISARNIHISSGGDITVSRGFTVFGVTYDKATTVSLEASRNISLSKGAIIATFSANYQASDAFRSLLRMNASGISVDGKGTMISATAGLDPRLSLSSAKGISLTNEASLMARNNSGGGGHIYLDDRGGLTLQGNSSIATTDLSDASNKSDFKGGDITVRSEYIFMDDGYLLTKTSSSGGLVKLDGVQSIFPADGILNGRIYPGYVGSPKVEGGIPSYLGGSNLNDLYGKNSIAVINDGSGGNVVLSGSLLNLSGDMASLPPADFTPTNLSNACELSAKGMLSLSGKGGSKASALDKAIFGY